MKSRICNKFLLNQDCSFTILDEEFEDGFVYVYIFLLKDKYNQIFVRTSKFQDVKCTIKMDGHYKIIVVKIPDYNYVDGEFVIDGEQKSILTLVDYFTYNKYNYFCICHLKQCFINICKSIFNSRASTDCKPMNIDKESTYKRDLIWAAINVIEYLVEMCQYKEAQRILDRITGCNGLCENSNRKGEGCGCT